LQILKSRGAKDLYYLYRRANTFRELVFAIDFASPTRIWIQLPDARKVEDMEEICLVSEHFEAILDDIFKEVCDEEMLRELEVLEVERTTKRSAAFLREVAQFVTDGGSALEALSATFYVSRLTYGIVPTPSTEEYLKFIESVPKEPKRVNNNIQKLHKERDIEKEIKIFETQLNMTTEEIKEQREIFDNSEAYLDGLKEIVELERELVNDGALIVNKSYATDCLLP